jgi:hypothetical protein
LLLLLQLLVAAQALISAYEAEQLVQQLRVTSIDQVRSLDSVDDEHQSPGMRNTILSMVLLL